jgi:hypothetical protein
MMGFPYTINKVEYRVDMNDLSDSTRLHLLKRKVNVNTIKNNRFITYSN